MGRIALTELYRHRRANSLYILVSAVMIAAVYAVAALIESKRLLAAVGDVLDDTLVIPALLTVVLVIMLIFTAVFQLYMSALLLSRRDREFGIYRLLGLPSWRLGGSLILEALIVGALAIVLGLISGIIISKLLAMALVRLMGLDVSMGLLFSPAALLETGTVLLVVAAVIGALGAVYVRSNDLPHFLQQPHDDDLMQDLSAWRMVWGLLGLLAAGLSLWFAFDFLPLSNVFRPLFHQFRSGLLVFLILFLGLGAAYLLLAFTLPVGLQLLSRHKWWRYDAGRLLVLTNLYDRLRHNLHSLWLATALATLTMAVLGSMAMVFQFGESTMDRAVTPDILTTGPGTTKVTKQLAKSAATVSKQVTLQTKVVAGKVRLFNGEHRNARNRDLYQVISLREYNRLRVVQASLPAVKVKGTQTVLLVQSRTYFQRRWLRGFTNSGRKITLPFDGTQLTVRSLSDVFPLGSNAYFDRALVVSNATYQDIAGTTDRVTGYWLAPSRAKTALIERLDVPSVYVNYATQNAAVMAGDSPVKISTKGNHDAWEREDVTLREPLIAAGKSLFGFGLFIALLLGAVFLFATASILLLKQLGAAPRDQRTVAIVTQLGMPTGRVERVLQAQTGLLFAVPLLLGIINAISISQAFSDILGADGGWLRVVVAVYAIVFMLFAGLTARLTTQVVWPKEPSSREE